jgi:hypothetical protein
VGCRVPSGGAERSTRLNSVSPPTFAFFMRHAPHPRGLAGRRQHGIHAQSALYRFAQSAIPCRPIFLQGAIGARHRRSRFVSSAICSRLKKVPMYEIGQFVDSLAPYSIEGSSLMKKNRVLSVEGNGGMRAAFEEVLKRRGFEVLPAASANEGPVQSDAITLVQSGSPVAQEAMAPSLLPAEEILKKPFGLARRSHIPKPGRR